MDRYTKVEKRRLDTPINENEIRITSGGPIRNYISYAISLFQEKHLLEIVLKAMGQAISKTVSIAEGIKRRLPWLHQDTSISSVSITDVWEPIEEGLTPVEQTRKVSMITITLSCKDLNTDSPGYQAPQVAEQPRLQHLQPQPRLPRAYNDFYEEPYGRGRSRGRGRGRNWSRNAYDYGNFDYQENGGYQNWGGSGIGGRGRNWGYRGNVYDRNRGGGGGGGRGYGGGGWGRMGGRARGGGNQA